MKAVAIIQARMGSTRLPGKVLKPLAKTTVLGCVVDRLKASRKLHAVVVATSSDREDDAVVHACKALGVAAVRGSAQDVLARLTHAARSSAADTVVRITADCPLIDGTLVDDMLAEFSIRSCDYLSNTLVRTYPRGLDAEIFTFEALARADREASRPYEREHVTPYLYQHPRLFRLHPYVDSSGADRSNMRWTLDTAQDYTFVQAVFAAIPFRSPRDVTTRGVLALLRAHPSIAQINAGVRQKHLGE
ncbi:MAG: cytidylyltransferase domain-containing protein [Candidatus Baltobacteraceae bacterium]